MIISDYFTEEEYKNPAFENIMKMARAYNIYQGVTPLHKANLLVSAINEDHVEQNFRAFPFLSAS